MYEFLLTNKIFLAHKNTVVYLGPHQTSTMEQFWRNDQKQKFVKHFYQKAISYMLDTILDTPVLKKRRNCNSKLISE